MLKFLSQHHCWCDYIISPRTYSLLNRETQVDWLKAIFFVIFFDILTDFKTFSFVSSPPGSGGKNGSLLNLNSFSFFLFFLEDAG